MIIVVKINSIDKPGYTVKKCAQKQPWGCTTLLNDTRKRNEFKYLAATYKGEIVGTFCIHGVAPDPHDKNRKVRFLLEKTDDKCDKYIKSIIQPIIDSDPKFKYIMSFKYYDIQKLKGTTESYNCDCSLEEIPLLEPRDIPMIELSQQVKTSAIELPQDIWFRFIIITRFWDSFNSPNQKFTEIEILAGNGILYYKTTHAMSREEIKLKEVQENMIKNIISIFHTDPTKAVREIKDSEIEVHPAHVNVHEIKFEAFSDSKLKTRIQYAQWSDNVLIVKSGFLKRIYKIIF